MAKKEIVQFAQYRLSRRGRGLYRKGRLYREGEAVILPVNERPPQILDTMEGKRPEWDEKKKLVVNASVLDGVIPEPTRDEIEQEAAKLERLSNKPELMGRAHGLGLDVNGTKLELATAIVAREAEIAADPDNDSDSGPDGSDPAVSTTGSAAE